MERLQAWAQSLFQGADLTKVRDDLLLEMIVSGKSEAFEILYDRHNDLLYRFLFRILLNEEVCLEVLQETWLKVYKNTEKFDGKASFKTWLYTIGKNTAFDRLKKKSDLLFDEPATIETFSDEEEGMLENMVRAATREKVWSALEQLAPDQKTVLAMWMEEVSLEEMAQVMELTPQAIKNLIHRSKKKLKLLLEGDGHE